MAIDLTPVPRLLGTLGPAALATLAVLTGCKEDGRAPVLEGIDDAVVAVGQELALNLRATDPDGDELDFGFDAEVDDIQDNATISVRPDGTAVFRWTPVGRDIGEWPFDFTVTDGSHTDTATTTIEVRTALEGTAPVFREPLGSGRTLDLGFASCIEVSAVVEDQDDAVVTIAQEEPLIADAELFQNTGLTAQWSWCPNKDQIEEDRYSLVLSADDAEHEKVLKNFLIVLRPAPRTDCPGKGPEVVHEAEDADTVLDIVITAEISDDMGLKGAPLLYYTSEEPRVPIDFAALEVAEMELQSGDDERGVWAGKIPNPIVDSPQGTTAPIYYIISASDDDDPDGTCDHITDFPQDGAFAISVTNSGQTGTAEPCDRCSADVQCGEATDRCVDLGAGTGLVCLAGCEGPNDCADDFECVPLTSADGLEASQCRPLSGTCEPVVAMCEDDSFEENDSRQQAANAGATTLGIYESLTSCPGDEDWYRVDLAAEGTFGSLVVGTGAGVADLDLGFYDVLGNELFVSATAGDSDEVIEECVAADTYYVRVFSSDAEPTENAYDLLLDHTPGACGNSCNDDNSEPDDSTGQATTVDLSGGAFTLNNRMLCMGDEDFYAVELDDGDTIVVDLTFTDTGSNEDLDTHFFDPFGVDLTPCSEDEPLMCSTSNGQSGTSNEHFEWTVDNASCPCIYYVAVVGYAGSENDYDIAIDTQ